jgi:hypothetical protein
LAPFKKNLPSESGQFFTFSLRPNRSSYKRLRMPSESENVTITIRLPKYLTAEVDRIADEIKATRSYAVRRLVAAAVRLYQQRRRRAGQIGPSV